MSAGMWGGWGGERAEVAPEQDEGGVAAGSQVAFGGEMEATPALILGAFVNDMQGVAFVD